MKKIRTFSRYPFGVAAEVISLDMIERGTEFWTYTKAVSKSEVTAKSKTQR